MKFVPSSPPRTGRLGEGMGRVLVFAVGLAVLFGSGCTNSPGTLGGGVASNQPWGPTSSPAVTAAEAQVSELSRRVQLLDDNNRQLHTQLAQSEQQMQVYRDETDLLRRQLADMSQRVQSSLAAAKVAENQSRVVQGQVRGMQASASMNSAGSIRPNADRMAPIGPPAAINPQGLPTPTTQFNGNRFSMPPGFDATLPGMQGGTAPSSAPAPQVNTASSRPTNNTLPGFTSSDDPVAALKRLGIPVYREDNIVRVVIPSDQLFTQGTTNIHPNASTVLDPIAVNLRSSFPRNRIGIEAYTDDGPIYGGAVATSHQLTSGQASAVLDFLTRRGGIPGDQLFTVAQGANHPRHSNQTPAGRAANRRIELVIYL